jgi:hypothetical protein
MTINGIALPTVLPLLATNIGCAKGHEERTKVDGYVEAAMKVINLLSQMPSTAA